MIFLLKADVLLLAGAFETINSFELDPAHYLSTPDYTWNVMLWLTDVTLKLISNTEKYQFGENTIRNSS